MLVKKINVNCFIKDGKKSFFITIKKNVKKEGGFDTLKNYIPIDLSMNDEANKIALMKEINNALVLGKNKKFQEIIFFDAQLIFSLNNNSEIKAFVIFDEFSVDLFKEMESEDDTKKVEIKAKEVSEKEIVEDDDLPF